MPCSFNFMAKIEYLIQSNSSSGAKKMSGEKEAEIFDSKNCY